MRELLSRLCRTTDGGAAVELGIIFPGFAILVLGAIEYGMAISQMMNVNQAAQIGAQSAKVNGFDATKIRAAVTAATGLTATVTEVCGCPAANSALTVMPCGPPLPNCAGDVRAGVYVTVNVQAPYAPAAPGLPSPLVAQSVIRVQ